MAADTKIVPFGKYNGKNVDALISDNKYCEWLTAQPWFIEKYRDIYNVIINYNGEPQDTPEHNILQARFLDHGFCLNFGSVAYPNKFDIKKQYLEDTRNIDKRDKASIERNEPINVEAVEFEVKGWDIIIHYNGGMYLDYEGGYKEGRYDDGDGWIYGPPSKICVECKPIVGDDYPSILRQMRKYPFDGYGKKALLINQFHASGATLDQVRQIFASAGIKIVMLSDIMSGVSGWPRFNTFTRSRAAASASHPWVFTTSAPMTRTGRPPRCARRGSGKKVNYHG